MKNLLIITGFFLLSLVANSQTQNNKATLHNKQVTLTDGTIIKEGDTIIIGKPAIFDNKFSYIHEPARAFGLSGGEAMEGSKYLNRFVIHFFQTKKNRTTKEQIIIAAIGTGIGESTYLCNIVDAINNGEIYIGGIEVLKKLAKNTENEFIETTDQLKQKQEDLDKRLDAISKASKSIGNQSLNNTTEPGAYQSTTSQNNPILNRLNQLLNDKQLSEANHQQLVQIITNKGEVANKKELVNVLKQLRNDKHLTIEEYDTIIDLML